MDKELLDAVLRATLFLFHVSCFTHLPPSSTHPHVPLTGSVWVCMREREAEGVMEREKALIYVKAGMREGAQLKHRPGPRLH